MQTGSAKLYHRDRLIGSLKNARQIELFSFTGQLDIDMPVEYKPVFDFLSNVVTDYLSNAKGAVKELPFDRTMLSDWYLDYDDGERVEIFIRGLDGTQLLFRRSFWSQSRYS